MAVERKKAKDCGPLFPGVPYLPMKRADLNKFALDVQRFGFTPWRKVRILSAVGRFCGAVAFKYSTRYELDIKNFCGPSWQAICKAVEHYEYDNKGGFSTLLAWWIKATFEKFLSQENIVGHRYHGDKYARQTVSIFSPVGSAKDGDGNETQLIDILPGEDGGEQLENIFLKKDVEKLLEGSELTDRQKDILKQSFGIGDGVQNEFKTIAKQHGISPERVRQIKINTIRRLKNSTMEKGLKLTSF